MKVKLARNFFLEGVYYKASFGGTEIPDSFVREGKTYKVQLPPEKPKKKAAKPGDPPPEPEEVPEGVIYLPEGTTEYKESAEEKKANEAKEKAEKERAKQETALSELPKHEGAQFGFYPPGTKPVSAVPDGPPGEIVETVPASAHPEKEDKAEAKSSTAAHSTSKR